MVSSTSLIAREPVISPMRPAPRPPAPEFRHPDTPLRPRFTIDGSDALEDHLAHTCERIAAGLRGLLPARKLEAVLLGGGYGRGEGGVLRTPDGDRPYNDLEFYVCLRGNRHADELWHGRALHVLGEILTPQAGVEVEFKITSLRELAAAPVSMFSYDLVSGHRWLVGDESLLMRCAHHRDAAQIPLAEATRLLMNRCTGLLLAQERLRRARFTAADGDFTRRNIAKAQLALGDAVLVSHGQYHRSAGERHRRLEQIALTEARSDGGDWLRDLCTHHATGVEFKHHPERSVAGHAELARVHEEVTHLARETWLWLESHRLRTRFRNVHEYIGSDVAKSGPPALRNLLVNAKVLGIRTTLAQPTCRHARERVLRALPLLLWEPAVLTRADLLAQVQRDLASGAADFPGLVGAYRRIWEQVN